MCSCFDIQITTDRVQHWPFKSPAVTSPTLLYVNIRGLQLNEHSKVKHSFMDGFLGDSPVCQVLLLLVTNGTLTSVSTAG